MVRSVSSSSGLKPNGEMNAIGLLVAAGMAVVMLPLLPFFVVLKVASWFRGGDGHAG
ncbi:DUF7535 family protein [Halosimplex sp. J119]